MSRSIEQRLFTVKQAAAYLGRSVYGTRELIWKGVLPYIQDGRGGKVWIDRKDVDGWIEKNKRREVS
jgi:excisionase family DNA binding protein